jgi:hypothetical protein
MGSLVEVGFCHGMAADVGGLGLCSSLLDSKDRFLEHVTWLNSASTRSIWYDLVE